MTGEKKPEEDDLSGWDNWTREQREEWARQLKAKHEQQAAEWLAAAREQAIASGKEPFDLDKLEKLWMPFKYGRQKPSREARLRELEPLQPGRSHHHRGIRGAGAKDGAGWVLRLNAQHHDLTQGVPPGTA